MGSQEKGVQKPVVVVSGCGCHDKQRQVHEEFVRVMFVEMLFWKGPKNAEYMRDGYKAMEPFLAPMPGVGLGMDNDALLNMDTQPRADAVDPAQVRL